MSKILVFFFALFAASYGESSFFESIQKCSIKDSECLSKTAEAIMHRTAEYGIPELRIPVLDPMQIKSETVSVVGLMDITLLDGVVEGMRDCKLESFNVDIDNKVTKFGTDCESFIIKGVYNVTSAPLIEKIFGNVVSGEGNGSIVMEKLKMNFINPFNVEKNEDGEIYLIPDLEKGEYSYEMEKVTFAADHISLGSQEIAPFVVRFLNRNWMYIISSFSRLFSDKGYSLGLDNVRKFFSYYPAKLYITDDLLEYVKK